MKKVFWATQISLWFVLQMTWANDDIKQVRVLWFEDPTQDASIAWSYMGSHPKHVQLKLKNGTLLTPTNHSIPNVSGTVIQVVELSGLTPNSKVEFSLIEKSKPQKNYWFQTAPQSGPFTLLFGGDSRSDRKQRRKMFRLLQSNLQQDPSIFALCHGGDFIGDGRKWVYWDRWLSDWELTYRPGGQILPIIPTRGNHELSSSLFDKVMGMPAHLKGKQYYATQIGPLRLYTLNTEISYSGNQKSWLQQNLKQWHNKTKFLIGNYHRPAWPAVKRPSGAKTHWVPLFDRYQFDLVFESDGHALKKTVPIYKGKKDTKKGVIYIGEGGLGVKQRTAGNRGQWYFKKPGYATSSHHFIKLNVSEENLKVQVVTEKNSRFDQFTLSPRKRL